MALSNKVVIITNKYALLLLLSTPLLAIGDELNYKEKSKLKEIQSRMLEVNKKIEEAKNQLSTLQIELRKNELTTTELTAQLENVQQKILKKKENLNQLNIAKSDQEKLLSNEKEILTSQIKTIYKMGKYNYFKILLNQENSSQVRRAIAYYDYDNYARSKRIKNLKGTLKNIQSIKSAILEQTSKLESLKDKQKHQLEKFNKYREERLIFIEDINKYIKQQGIELFLLKENERELGNLLNKLKPHQKNKRNPIKKEFSFRSKKGELIWPINGKLLKKYGAKKKTTGLKWKGVLIEAKKGSQVSAVSNGEIVFADWFRNFGLLVIIEHENDFLSLYGHNQKILKTTGDLVEAGEKIATVGDSGGQENSALYFEIREGKNTLDPSQWCKK